jgi:hypothetical protein
MIYVGLDDTDTLDDPGTNQLARHLVRELADRYNGRIVIRHQLLEDPRVPCTKKNGCASLLFEPVGWAPPTTGRTADERWAVPTLPEFIDTLRDIIIPWCPAGSDPGLCVTETVPPAVIAWGLRCKRELVTQLEARQIAADHDIHLEGLGGTEDGVIGALAAVGLMATKNDGRVVHFGLGGEDWYDVTGCLTVEEVLARGVQEVRTMDGASLTSGTVDIGKRLRPNYRQGKVVLYVTPNADTHWDAVRIA